VVAFKLSVRGCDPGGENTGLPARHHTNFTDRYKFLFGRHEAQKTKKIDCFSHKKKDTRPYRFVAATLAASRRFRKSAGNCSATLECLLES
jgi:hypothetical protein